MSGTLARLVEVLTDMQTRERLRRMSAGRRRERRAHVPDESRSVAWNEWRERQALGPVAKAGPARRPAPRRELTAAERRARRLSTRSSRRRAARRGDR